MSSDADFTRVPAAAGTARKPRALVRIVKVIARHGVRHRAVFLKGCAAAIFMVAARLAMPWPAHELMHYWKLSEEARAEAVTHALFGMDWSLTLGLAFLGLLVALGLGDAIVRVQFARFSIATMRDLRSAAIDTALQASARDAATAQLAGQSGAEVKPLRSGDLVARLVGDTARVKAGLKGFLVHVVPNSALYAGVTVILYILNVKLGLIFGAAGLGMAAATILGARAMYRMSKKYRKKEGRLADRIDRSLRAGVLESGFETTNASSGRAEASLTRIQSLTTWSTYVFFGLAVLATVIVGTREIAAGTLEPRDMVIFLMYALILRGPTVRLARQGSRLGKTFGSARRILKVLEREAPDAGDLDPALPDPAGSEAGASTGDGS